MAEKARRLQNANAMARSMLAAAAGAGTTHDACTRILGRGTCRAPTETLFVELQYTVSE